MPKLIPGLIICLLCTHLCFSQSIDSLHSTEQVLVFLKKLLKEDSLFTILPESKRQYRPTPSRPFPTLPFEKADFDRNNYTDLLFNGYGYGYSNLSLVVLSYGNDSFQVKLLKGCRAKYIGTRTLTFNGATYIHALQVDYGYDRKKDSLYQVEKADTLQFAFGEFVEKTHPGHYNIQKIAYCRSGGLGMTTYQVTLSKDSVTLIREQPTSIQTPIDTGGVFIARLDKATRANIHGILNQINFPDLLNEYSVSATCNSTGELRITYDNGKVKKISDYGLIGTYGLAALQTILLDLGSTQQWTYVRETEPFIGCTYAP